MAVSGGVDSSTAAYYLIQAGYEVVGIYLDLWKVNPYDFQAEKPSKDMEEKLNNLSKKLDFPIQILDKREEFYQTIVKYFLQSLQMGLTPNPCVVCNRNIKFKILFDYLSDMDADFIATGHYARTKTKKNGSVNLLKGIDASKDQSYYLALLDQKILKRTIFPLGEFYKENIKKMHLQTIDPTSNVSESQDLCFLSDVDYRSFLMKYCPESIHPGPIVDMQGRELGRHTGLALYTIGQRKGIQISAADPYYVIGKSIQKNYLIVGHEQELGRNNFMIHAVNWISGNPSLDEKLYAVKIRYRAKPVRALTKMVSNNTMRISTEKELRDITPGQFAVLYHKDSVIAGGEISI